MPKFLPMESLFYGMFGPIWALAVILELIEYAELLNIFVQRQRRRQKKKNLIKPLLRSILF